MVLVISGDSTGNVSYSDHHHHGKIQSRDHEMHRHRCPEHELSECFPKTLFVSAIKWLLSFTKFLQILALISAITWISSLARKQKNPVKFILYFSSNILVLDREVLLDKMSDFHHLCGRAKFWSEY